MTKTNSSFVTKHGLWDEEKFKSAAELLKRIKADNIQTVRVSFVDQHGILRGKTILSNSFEEVLYNGVGMTTTLLLKDSSHRTAFSVWEKGGGMERSDMTGACDFLILPDPDTFRVLPWSENSGWILCDCFHTDGSPVSFSTRQIFKNQLTNLANQQYSYLSGIELEFSLYKLDDKNLNHADCTQPGNPPIVSPVTHGFQYLTEQRYDDFEPILEIIRKVLIKLDLPLQTMEVEFGPSQVELTFSPVSDCAGADNVIIAKNAIKQVYRRHGYHATFMCRPAFENVFSNGWHLHQSLIDDRTGKNAFSTENANELLSLVGEGFLAGLLKYAKEGTIFSTPTINGYKRYRPFTLAPNNIVWGKDNRGAMLRVVGNVDSSSVHLENRAGEPAANPYLYMASQIIAGIDGIRNKIELPEAVDTPYDDKWEQLPRNLYEAVNHLKRSKLFREALGQDFIDYYIKIKEFEINRYLSQEVTDWEQKEYFENF